MALALDQGHPRKWLILIAISLGMMLGVFNVALVNIAVPALVRDLDSTVAGVSWVLNAFNITQAVLLLSFGRLADRLGSRRVFLISVLVFTVFSLACGLAQNAGQLIVLRIFQAIGSAGMVPVSLVILLAAFPSHQHGLATGLWGALGQLAAITGPPVGGVLIGHASWRWVFFMNVPVGVVALVMAFLFVPERQRDTRGSGLDLPGIALSAATLFCLTIAIIQGNTWGWDSTVVLAFFASFIALAAVFVGLQHRSRNPMLDLRLFRIRPFCGAIGMSVASGIGMAAGTFILILFMINLLGFSETRAAVAMIPASVVTMILSPFAGRLVDLVGPRYLGAAGALLFAVGFALFATLRADADMWSVVWRTIFIGIAMAIEMPALTAAGLASLPQGSSGVGAGMISTGRQVGNVVGLALLIAIYASAALAGADTTVEKAAAYVARAEGLPTEVRGEIIGLIEQRAEAAAGAESAAGSFFDPTVGLSEVLSGKVDSAVAGLIEGELAAIAREESGRVFVWPFLTAAILSLFGVPLAFLLGRRLGDQRPANEDVEGRRSTEADAAEEGGLV